LKPGGAETVAPDANIQTPRDKKAPAGKTMAKPGDGTPPSSANTEAKPTEAKPSIAAKPPGMKAKPSIAAKPSTETSPLGAGPKPETRAKSPGVEANTETKTLGAGGKPETGAKPPAGASSNKAADSKPTPHAVAAPQPVGGPHAKPSSKNKKPE
jgi:DnaK suppressor protein